MAERPKANQLIEALEKARAASTFGGAQTEGAPSGAAAVPDLVRFVGFLGDTVSQLGIAPPDGAEWRLFYLDWWLHSWLLVEEDGIVRFGHIKDDQVPAERCDVIWVKADARVGQGHGAQSTQSRFLSGAFTRAGDIDMSLMGGTSGAATGVFCEARSPSCCYGSKSR